MVNKIVKNSIFISGNVPSSKNSKRIFKAKNGRTFLKNSATVEKYIKEHKMEWVKNKNIFIEKIKKYNLAPPYNIFFYLVRGTKHKFDYNNISQILQDLMVEYGYIEDDNADCVIPHFIPYSYDKNNCGVYIGLIEEIKEK